MRFANFKTEMSSPCVHVQHLCLFLQIEKATFTVTLAGAGYTASADRCVPFSEVCIPLGAAFCSQRHKWHMHAMFLHGTLSAHSSVYWAVYSGPGSC